MVYESCKKCPMVMKDYFHLSSIYGNEDEAIQDCWCDKLGCKISWIVPCEENKMENDIEYNEIEYIKPRMTRYERNYRHKKKLKYFYDYIQPQWSPSGVWKKHYGTPSEYLCRFYRGKRSKFLKRQSNKKIRRHQSYISNGGSYKKIFNYWWELW